LKEADELITDHEQEIQTYNHQSAGHQDVVDRKTEENQNLKEQLEKMNEIGE
jgi:chromosome segregation ATPase